MKRNVGSQYIVAQMIATADGTPVTSGTCNVAVQKDSTAGTGGTASHVAGGMWEYAPIAGDTDGAHVSFQFTLTNAINTTVQVYPTFPQTVDNDVLNTSNETLINAVPTVTEFNARTQPTADYFDWTTDTVANVTTVATNTDMVAEPLTAVTTRSALGLATANMDTQFTASATATGFATTAEIADVPTVSEMNARTQPTADYFSPTDQLTESYAALNTAPTMTQAILYIQQCLAEQSVATTVETIKKIDGSTVAATNTLDSSSSPTSRTAATRIP